MSAIFAALHYISNLKKYDCKYVVCIDSKSAILAIKNKTSSVRSDLITPIREFAHHIISDRNSLSFIWIPSHCDIKANDCVDRYAKWAANDINQSEPWIISLDKHEYHQLNISYIHQSFIDSLSFNCNHYSRNCLEASPCVNFWNTRDRNLGRRIYSSMARLRLNSFKTKYCKDVICPCGADLSCDHLLLHCPIFKQLIRNSILYPLFHNKQFSLKELLSNYDILKKIAIIINNSPFERLV